MVFEHPVLHELAAAVDAGPAQTVTSVESTDETRHAPMAAWACPRTNSRN